MLLSFSCSELTMMMMIVVDVLPAVVFVPVTVPGVLLAMIRPTTVDIVEGILTRL